MNGALPWPWFVATLLALAAAIGLHVRWMPMPLVAGILATLALAWAWRRRRQCNAPGWVRLLALAGLVALVVATLGNLFGREAGSALLAALLALKLLETAQRRDARVTLAGAAFLAMCGFFFGQGPTQTVGAALVLVLLMATLVELSRPAPVAARLPWSTPALALGARLLALGAPFGLACFLFFPRLSAPMWGAPEDAFQGRTGISDTMDPGGLSALALDDTPAMRVRFDGALPPPEQRYWRGLVFWTFDGRAWGGSNAISSFRTLRDFRPTPVLEPRGPSIRHTITLEPTDQRWLFALDAPGIAPEDASLTTDFQLRARDPVTTVRAYAAESFPQHRMQPWLSPSERYLATTLGPPGNPQSRALAQRWREELGDARQIAQAALALFNNDFIYSLEPPLLAADAVDDFLFTTRTGFCEHYASAFAFLMRAAGIPARVVVGFQGGYWNAAGNYLVVANADAHAWTEIWIEGEGWVRFDPTAAVAPERVQSSAREAFGGVAADRRGWLGMLGDRWDLAGYWWNQAVVQFSALRQRQLLRPLGLDDASGQQLAIALVVAALAALGFALWAAAPRHARRDPLLAAWHRIGAALAAAGLPRAPHEGPASYAARVSAALPDDAAAISALSRDFTTLRYAGGEHDATRVASFLREAAAFRVRGRLRAPATKRRRAPS